jgi:crotonobetainyl-CoA:carnitine CoA-transferase CaiB-like acyl-CoA transferase
MLVEHIAGAAYDPPTGRPVYERLVTPDRRPYRTRDGYLSVLVYNDKQWQRFAALAERPELARDARFRTQAARSAHMADFCAAVAAILATRASAEWVELLEQAEIPVARLNSTAELYSDPHLADVGFFRSLDDPHDGRLRLPDHPVRFARTPAGFATAGPMPGEHTAQVLAEIGLADAEIAALEQQGVIRCWRPEEEGQ